MTLCIVAIFKNEGLNMKEFLDHYEWQGVDHVYLIDNGSTDNGRDVLRPYERRGFATVVEKLEKFKHVDHINDLMREQDLKNRYEWIMTVDLDEFWYCKDRSMTIKNVLRTLDDTVSCVYTHWTVFGSNGLVKHPASLRHALVYGHARTDAFEGKCIVRARRVARLHVHYHELVPGSIVMVDNLRFALNHYMTQSREFWETVKMKRGDSDNRDSNRDWDTFASIDERHQLGREDALPRILSGIYDGSEDMVAAVANRTRWGDGVQNVLCLDSPEIELAQQVWSIGANAECSTLRAPELPVGVIILDRPLTPERRAMLLFQANSKQRVS
jgi:hypothetical protein